MRLASYRLPDTTESFGIVTEAGIVDLRGRTGLADLKSLLGVGVDSAREYADDDAGYSLSEVELLPPVTNPDNIIAVGFNTRSHLEEAEEFFNTTLEQPPYPHLFIRTAASHVGHESAVVIPQVSPSLDFEGEIALVIGKPGRYIAKEDALDHVAGIACYNDGSVREFQQHSPQVTAAKNFHASGSFGPWLVTVDEVGPLDQLTLETRVNGEVQQHLELDDLFFGFAELIEYASQPFHLQAGDVIVTGSPAGIGAIQGRYLKAGDIVEVTIPTVGTLRNAVTEESRS